MDHEDRLDALLSARRAAAVRNGAWMPVEDAELALLLTADDRLAFLREATPAADFADALEQRLLARSGALAVQHAVASGDAPTIAGSDYPTLPNGHTNGAFIAYDGDAAPTRPDLTQPVAGEWPVPSTRTSPARRAARVLRFPSGGTWMRSLAAAVVLLVLGASVLSAAADAAPGSFLFGLRRAEQWFSVQVASDPAAKVRLHLQYAEQALGALDTAVAHQAGDPAYAAALATLRTEAAAASDGLQTLAPGATRDDLAAQLETFQRHARGDLRAALPGLSWPDRVITTTALGELGDDSVPRISTVTVRPDPSSDDHGGDSHGGNPSDNGAAAIHRYRVEVSGSGFAAGAMLMVNGKVAGSVLSVSPSQLVAEVTLDPAALHNMSIGIQNPDSTAATSSITHGAPVVAPTAAATATPDDHGGHSGHSGDGSGSGSGGGSGGSATPSPGSGGG
ncbi:MAG TPA: hypothetical protein VFU88_16000 [Ktedonobacterales bacterium]|nr:hypothetical protein [Ktedonobacterales bacterium]